MPFDHRNPDYTPATFLRVDRSPSLRGSATRRSSPYAPRERCSGNGSLKPPRRNRRHLATAVSTAPLRYRAPRLWPVRAPRAPTQSEVPAHPRAVTARLRPNFPHGPKLMDIFSRGVLSVELLFEVPGSDTAGGGSVNAEALLTENDRRRSSWDELSNAYPRSLS